MLKTFVEFVEETYGESASDAAARLLKQMGYPDASIYGNLRRRNYLDDRPSVDPPPQQTLDRPLYRSNSLKPPTRDMGKNPWPESGEVDKFEPAKGQFGFNKKTPDFYQRASNTVKPGFKAKYNQYTPSDEEVAEIMQLHQKGYTPLGITLELGDKFNKLVPTHVVQKIISGE